MIYHAQTGIYSAFPTYTELFTVVAKHRNKYIPYRDIPRYTGIYIDRKGIYSNIRGITQYIRIGKMKKITRFEPRTSCILHRCSYHCTISVDARMTFGWYK